MRCTLCHVPLEDGLITIRYRGQGRRLTVRFRGVEALVCPRCRLPVVSATLQLRLEEIGLFLAETAGPMAWQAEPAA